MKNGFTLIELVIVLAIMAILGAIAVPNFTETSFKARLKADIQSARVIDNAKDLYENETGNTLNESATEAIKTLFDNRYLKRNYTTPQTSAAVWELDGIIKVNITNCAEKVKNLYDSLSDEEKLYVKNGS